MWGQRVAYLLLLSVCVLFYILFQQWFSWFLLVTVGALPLFSLLLSLPAMLTVRPEITCPRQVRVGVPAKTGLKISCPFPAPPVRCTIRLKNLLTGESYVGIPGEYVPVTACGVMEITYQKIWVWDYLGLFRRGFAQETPCRVIIEPKPVPCDVPQYQQSDAEKNGWKPKAGGFAENHELRLYRPGDELRLLHHKMSAKTGKLIYREPVVPLQEQQCLVMTLSGTPALLNTKLGRFLYISRQLLEKGQAYELRCQTGNGLQIYQVTDAQSQSQVLHTLLKSAPTTGEWLPEDLSGYHHIGGDL